MASDILEGKTLYMIAGIQRTGTGYLISLLRSHPDLFCWGEPLIPGAAFDQWIAQEHGPGPLTLAQRAELLPAWLDLTLARRREPVTGLKFMQDYTAHCMDALTDYIKSRGVRLVRVVRRNTLKVHLSRLRSEAQKLWHTDRPVDYAPLEVPTDGLVSALSRIAMEDAKLDAALEDLGALRVVYEDLCADPAPILDAVQDHLGLERRALTSDMRKIAPDDPRRAMANHDAVRRALAGTRFMQCLEPEDGPQ